MAEEADSGLSDSVLETPVYVLALVFFVFLAVSLLFEHGVHALTHACRRRHRPGLAKSVEKLVQELTLLGFVSLLLTTFAKPLSKMCVGYSPSMDGWTILSNLRGCPCCLQHTAGVSLCSEMAMGCLYNTTSRQPFCDCEFTGSEAYTKALEVLEQDDNPYGELAASGQLDPECLPFRVNELSYFADVAVNALASLTGQLGLSAEELCNGLRGNGTAGTIPATFTALDDLEFDLEADWEGYRRRSLLASGGGGDGSGGGGDPLGFVLSQINSNSTSDTSYHILPKPKLFKCTGPFFSSACPAGQVLLISGKTLHQVHIWLFLIATFHVATSIVQILLSELLVRTLWRRWEAAALEAEACLGMAADGAAALARSSSPLREDAPCQAGKEADLAADDAPGQQAPPPGGAADVENAAVASTVAAGEGVGQEQAGCGAAAAAAAGGAWRTLRRRWRFRRAPPPHGPGLLLEGVICLLQACSPLIVTRSTFLVMRAAWLSGATQPPLGPAAEAKLAEDEAGKAGAGGGARQHDGAAPGGGAALKPAAAPPGFVQHVQRCLDADLPVFVGLSLEMGGVLVAVLLLMGAFGWAQFIVIVCAGAALVGANVALVATLRHCCRGGRPNPPKLRRKWWRNPQRLLPTPIRLLLFLCSFAFSTAAFFAWQFGSSSCLFGAGHGSWDVAGPPGWISLMLAGLLLSWTSAATIPAFTLAVHTHTRWGEAGAEGSSHGGAAWHGGSAAMGSNGQPGAAVQAGGVDHQPGAAAAAAEAPGGLQAEAERLRARLAHIEACLAAQHQAGDALPQQHPSC